MLSFLCLLLFQGVSKGQEKYSNDKSLIQFSGVVVSADSLQPIPFTNGRPDFSKWKVGDDLKVDGMTGADSDFPKIYEKMKQEYGFKTQKEAKESRSYSSPFR